MLAVASIHTLKRGNEKCGNKQEFILVKDSIDVDINKDQFEKLVEVLIDN